MTVEAVRRRDVPPFDQEMIVEVSWVAQIRFSECIGTLTPGGRCAATIASWTAPVLCRFCTRSPDRKAPEDWRSPKPGRTLVGSCRGETASDVCDLQLFRPPV